MKHTRTLADREDLLELLRDFHGHIGPYVVAGIRMGRLARTLLGADPHFGMEADVCCPDAPPPSCALDGIQLATGCTLGKRSIRHAVGEGVVGLFRNRETGARVRLTLRVEAVTPAVETMRERGDEAGAAVILGLTDAELFAVEENV